MTPERFNAEARLQQGVAFVDELLESNILTATEAREVLEHLAGENPSLIGGLHLRVRLDKDAV